MEEVATDLADCKVFELQDSLLKIVDSHLATSLLQLGNSSALEDIHKIARQIMLRKSNMIYPINWKDLHNVAPVRTEVSTLFALSLMKITADMGSWPI